MSNVINPVFRQTAIKGRSKTFFKSDNLGQFILLFDAEDPKISLIRNRISQIVFELLTDCFIPNHFIKNHGLKEQVVSALEMLPFAINIHAFTDAAMATRLHCATGMRLKNYLIEIALKDESNTLLSSEHVVGFEWLTKQECELVFNYSRRIMDIIYSFFKAFGIIVTSCKLEYGRGYVEGQMYDILLADEMSPKNISFMIPDMIEEDEKSLYIEIAKRLGIFKYE